MQGWSEPQGCANFTFVSAEVMYTQLQVLSKQRCQFNTHPGHYFTVAERIPIEGRLSKNIQKTLQKIFKQHSHLVFKRHSYLVLTQTLRGLTLKSTVTDSDPPVHSSSA